MTRWVRALFAGAGVALCALGFLHLAVLPLITPWFDAAIAPGSPALGAFLLDHAVAGLLLLPLGGLTVYAARHLPAARWARIVCVTAAATVVILPMVTVACVGRDHLAAWPFRLALVILAVAALLLIAGAIALVRSAPRVPSTG